MPESRASSPAAFCCRRTLFLSAVLSAFLLTNSHAAGVVSDNPLESRFRFDIDAGVATSRLNALGSQTGVQLLYNPTQFEKITLNAVSGDYTAKEALMKLIAGKAIKVTFRDEKTASLVVDTSSAVASALPPATRRASRSREKSPPLDRRAVEPGIQEVTVSAAPRDFSQLSSWRLLSLDRADIESGGYITAPGAVRTLPQVFGGGPTEDTTLGYEARTNVARGSGINLRGLGASSTLVLMNGRRLAPGGSEALFVDVSNIPFVAVERVDLLPDVSSTFYGADAAIGVVNFVMRESFDGLQTEGYIGSSTRDGGLGEIYVSQLIGAETEHGHGLFALEVYSRDGLPAANRRQAHSDLRAFGGSNFNVMWSNPGNIMFGTTIWAVPRGQDGMSLTPEDFLKGAANLQDQYKGADILPAQDRISGFGTWRQELNESVSLFGDVLLARRSVRAKGSGALGVFTVPPTNAFYASPVALSVPLPFSMTYSFYDDLGPQLAVARVQDIDITPGIDIRFGNEWRAVATAGFASETIDSEVRNTVNGAALSAALADSNRETAFNPFGDGSYTNPATLESLRGSTVASYDSRIISAGLIVQGPLAELPGGSARLSLGGDTRLQSLRADAFTDTPVVPTNIGVDRYRSVNSAFAELSMPLIGPSNRLPGVEALRLSVAERYERYNDFGETLSPRFSVSWTPLAGVVLHGAYSRSFRPPGLLDLDESNNVFAITSMRDSQTNAPVPVLLWAGKNRDLKEETAHSWTAGIEIESESKPGAALAITYFRTTFNGRLNTPTASADLLTNPTLSPLVTRDPSADYRADVCSRAPQIGSAFGDCLTTPIVAIIDLRTRNDAQAFTHGIDVTAKREWLTAVGSFGVGLNGTYIFSFAEAKAENLPLVDRVSTQNYPTDLRLRGSARWRRGGLEIATYLNFMNRYKDVASFPERNVASSTTFDIHAGYTLRGSTWGWLGDTTFALGVDNLFDRDPSFLNNAAAGIGYDQENGTLAGRVASFTVRKKW